MEILLTATSIMLIVGFLLNPIVLFIWLNKLKMKYTFVVYLLIGLVTTAIFSLALAWWGYTSDHLLMAHFGYDIDGMNANEFYANVAPQNLAQVKSMEISVMGIGWPLKAIIMYGVCFPYLIFVYTTLYSIQYYIKFKKRGSEE